MHCNKKLRGLQIFYAFFFVPEDYQLLTNLFGRYQVVLSSLITADTKAIYFCLLCSNLKFLKAHKVMPEPKKSFFSAKFIFL